MIFAVSHTLPIYLIPPEALQRKLASPVRIPGGQSLTIRDHAYPLDDLYCYVAGWCVGYAFLLKTLGPVRALCILLPLKSAPCVRPHVVLLYLACLPDGCFFFQVLHLLLHILGQGRARASPLCAPQKSSFCVPSGQPNRQVRSYPVFAISRSMSCLAPSLSCI